MLVFSAANGMGKRCYRAKSIPGGSSRERCWGLVGLAGACGVGGGLDGLGHVIVIFSEDMRFYSAVGMG